MTSLEEENDRLVEENQQLRYERKLMDKARRLLDRFAGDLRLSPDEHKQAAEISQRIVDEIGRLAANEEPLGPSYRDQIAKLRKANASLTKTCLDIGRENEEVKEKLEGVNAALGHSLAMSERLAKRVAELEVSEAELERLSHFLLANIKAAHQLDKGPVPLAIELLSLVKEAAPAIVSLVTTVLNDYMSQLKLAELDKAPGEEEVDDEPGDSQMG